MPGLALLTSEKHFNQKTARFFDSHSYVFFESKYLTDMQNYHKEIRIMVIILFGGLLSSCKNESSQNMAQAAPQYPVLKITEAPTTLQRKYPAVIQGEEDIEIRPRIDGYLQKIYVEEGSRVKKGDLLFKIDAPQYNEVVKAAQSAVKNAELKVQKATPLVEEGIINQYELDAAKLDLEAQRASLAQAQANQGYTFIKSPVDGVVGAIPYRTGSLVSPQVVAPLTVVSDIDNVKVYFSMDEKEYLEFYADHEGNSVDDKLKSFPKVKLQLSDGSILESEGEITAIGGLLNQQTGSARLTAVFPNANQRIRSGGSGKILIPQSFSSAIMVPQKSTFELQDKRMVYKVKDDRVFTSEIKTMPTTVDNKFVVTEGLSEGDIIVFEGAGTLRDSLQIKPNIITQ
ncbi:RND family efflux transporter MFP subunit [Zunongwangia atlantica 22II14-10F7]|uniref:RND family efflux transporter MFP subunit n=2 Tax=Zunongwangia TaxID=417127 RepID=A0A1Y1SZP0_9FLAO|nr:RND family efflux transporter MFP subunit [Zunongwangia atlantica 22II14-10F7]